jgi:hypothetical protein
MSRREAMASKSKRVNVVMENSTTGEVRTFNFSVTILDSDCPQTNPVRQRVVIVRRVPSWKRLSKVRVKVL